MREMVKEILVVVSVGAAAWLFATGISSCCTSQLSRGNEPVDYSDVPRFADYGPMSPEEIAAWGKGL